MKYALIVLLSLTFGSSAWADDSVIDRIQAASVTVKTDDATGSGVIYARKDGDTVNVFVHTAGHVIDGLRKTREVVIGGDKKTLVEFGDASIASEFYEDGRRIGETKFDAKVLRYSDAEHGEDLAVLHVRKKNYVPVETSIEFIGTETPKLGTELWHIGSLYGVLGSNTLTEGILSKIGRVLPYGANGVIFDQVAVTAVGGSSGGGVFQKSDGKCIGLLVRGAPDGQFNFIVPTRRMREWAKRAGVEWSMDRNVPMPSEEELRKLPIEDAGSDGIFSSGKSDMPVEFPFLLAK